MKILQVNLFPAGYSQIEPLCGSAGVRAAGLRQSAPTPLYGALQKPVLTEDSQVSGEETVLESTPELNKHRDFALLIVCIQLRFDFIT